MMRFFLLTISLSGVLAFIIYKAHFTVKHPKLIDMKAGNYLLLRHY